MRILLQKNCMIFSFSSWRSFVSIISSSTNSFFHWSMWLRQNYPPLCQSHHPKVNSKTEINATKLHFKSKGGTLAQMFSVFLWRDVHLILPEFCWCCWIRICQVPSLNLNFFGIDFSWCWSERKGVCETCGLFRRFCFAGNRKDDGKATDVKLKKIMLTRPSLATTLATTAARLGSTDPEARELAAEAEVCLSAVHFRAVAGACWVRNKSAGDILVMWGRQAQRTASHWTSPATTSQGEKYQDPRNMLIRVPADGVPKMCATHHTKIECPKNESEGTALLPPPQGSNVDHCGFNCLCAIGPISCWCKFYMF